MLKVERVCNMCGKKFDEWDEQEDFAFVSYQIGYGSKYDGSKMRIDLCCNCMDNLIEKCKISPICQEVDNI